MNTTHNSSNRRHQLSISVLNNIDTFDGKQGHKLDDWLADVENAAAIVEEDEVVVAKGKARGLAQDLIKEHENQPWPHIKEQLRNHLNNANIHTYTTRFMEIQQKHSETLTAYINRFKKEAKHCNFDSHQAKIRIFLKGLTKSSGITLSVYEKGPTDHHTPNQDCSSCGQLGHPWFTCLHIICDGCNRRGHTYRHCWDRIPPSRTASPPKNHHNH